MLYVSNQALYFHSYFNDSIIFFGKHTKMKIPLIDIKNIQKAKNAKIFDNSIKITLKNDQKVFLTSFLSRDSCYTLIIDQIRRIKMMGIDNISSDKSLLSSSDSDQIIPKGQLSP